VALADPSRLAAAVEGATPFLRFRLDRAFAAADLSSNEGRARAAERALAIVAEHPTDLVRDQYVMDVASRCRIEPARLREQLARVLARPAARRASSSSSSSSSSSRGEDGPWAPDGGRVIENRPDGGAPGEGGAERGVNGRHPAPREGPALEVLRHAVHDPESVGPWLDAALFDDPVLLGTYEALLASDTHADAMASAPPAVADLLARLMVDEPSSEPFEAVRLLCREVARRELNAVRLASATAADGTQALTDATTLGRIIDGLRTSQTATESANRLLAWLEHRD
jgi:hypothetical protein